MIVGSLLITGQHHHKENWHIFFVTMAQVSKSAQRRRLVHSANKLPCIDRGLLKMINACRELTFHKVGTSFYVYC
jgi:hypothetical protein